MVWGFLGCGGTRGVTQIGLFYHLPFSKCDLKTSCSLSKRRSLSILFMGLSPLDSTIG